MPLAQPLHRWAMAGRRRPWLITERAQALYKFMARRGILLRLFTHSSSLRFGLPAEETDWARLVSALEAFVEEAQ